jgi:hypothetical protein
MMRDSVRGERRVRPVHIVVKDLPDDARGRSSRDISDTLHVALLRHGVPPEATSRTDGKLQAVRIALAAARAGDALVLPVHADAARVAVRHETAGSGCTTALICWNSTAPPSSLAPGHRGLLGR